MTKKRLLIDLGWYTIDERGLQSLESDLRIAAQGRTVNIVVETDEPKEAFNE
jgi:hypothetical protein